MLILPKEILKNGKNIFTHEYLGNKSLVDNQYWKGRNTNISQCATTTKTNFHIWMS